MVVPCKKLFVATAFLIGLSSAAQVPEEGWVLHPGEKFLRPHCRKRILKYSHAVP